MLKKLMIGADFAAMIATPALAQSYDPDLGSGNTINLPAAEATNGAVGFGADAPPTSPRSFGGPYA